MSVADGTTGGFDFVVAAELDRASVRVARSPLPSVFTLARDALQHGRQGTPRAWRAAVVSRLRRRDVVALGPLVDPRCGGWPGLLAANEQPHESLGDALERVISTPGVELLEALERDPDVAESDRIWDPVRRGPDRWLRAYVDAMFRSWQGVEPLWRGSVALLEQEVERVAAAVDRGVGATELVTEVSARATLVDGELRLARALGPRRLTVPGEGVILAPMIAGSGAGILSSPGDRFVRIAYTLPGVWRAFDAQAPSPASLDALVGAQRARLLRRLDRPYAAGELAQALYLRPSAMTFHLRALEAAGLIIRERRGRYVIVQRTERGTVLLALYDSP